MQDTLSVFPSRLAAEVEQASSHLHTRLHTLPAQLTPLLGREHEVEVGCTLLRCPQIRLVTLTGTGGVGKTRLGLHIAEALLDEFAGDVYFVPFAPISDPHLVIPTLAQACDLKETPDWSPLEHLKAFLYEKHCLLLLDNFEHLVTVAPLLVELLQACPRLKILVTSRAVLHISGEHEFPVPPLALPDMAHLPENEALAQYPAVALFVQRARAIKPDFQLTRANARAVAEICVRLDGLPLAIELAAARIKLLSPHGLLVRLGHRLHVLTGGARNLPARQQTLRNTIAWSYNLLDEQEQRLFRRLSIFVGGCTLEAIEALWSALEDGEATIQVLDGVASLIDKSLLQHMEQEEGEPRLLMLETIREFGWECLQGSQELEAAQGAHAHYFLALAEQAQPHLHGQQQALWVKRLEQEHDNLRAALEWALEEKAGEETKERRKLALRLSATMTVTLHTLGRIQALLGDLTAACQSYHQSLTLCLQQGERFIIPFNLEGLAGVLTTQGELRWAAQLWGAAEALRELIASPLPPFDRAGYEQAVSAARAQLGELAFAAAWQEGRRMTPEQVLVSQGSTTMPPPTTAESLSTPATKTSPPFPAELTEREVEVLRLLAQGLTNALIAEQLIISLHTVNAHVRSIFNKLDVNSRSAATRFAITHHLM